LFNRRITLQRSRATYGLEAIEAAHPQRKADVKPRELTGEVKMLWTITVILVILWLLGFVSGYTLGGWIHILLVLAIIVLIFNLLSGRRAL
jgi:uncharacterized membrane protein